MVAPALSTKHSQPLPLVLGQQGQRCPQHHRLYGSAARQVRQEEGAQSPTDRPCPGSGPRRRPGLRGVLVGQHRPRLLPADEGSITLEGLSGPVDVKRDGHGIPQIYASSDEDLFMAQGYVQAQDRFYEMDVRRHMTSGRLSEMFGKGQVDNDAFLRTLGWHRVAQKEYDEKLSESTKKYLQAYAKGSTPTSRARTAPTSRWSTRPSGSPTTTRRRSGRRSTRSPGSRRWPGTCAATCRTRSTGP